MHGSCSRLPRLALWGLALLPVGCASPKGAPAVEDSGTLVSRQILRDPVQRHASFQAVFGPEGIAVFAQGAPDRTYALEVGEAAQVEVIGTLPGDGAWVSSSLPNDLVLRARDTHSGWRSEPFSPAPVSLRWQNADLSPTLLADEPWTGALDLGAPDLRLGQPSLVVWLDLAGEARYLPAACASADCWTDGPTPLRAGTTLAALAGRVPVPLAGPVGAPEETTLHAALVLGTPAGKVTLAEATRPIRVLGGAWAWGDLHAHSGGSYDACEDPEDNCAWRGDIPGEDFFGNAASEGLDFAAITDHAEMDDAWPTGLDGPPLALWDSEGALVADAAGTLGLPLLGYEWTNNNTTIVDGHRESGHRTVLLADPSACDAYRIAGTAVEDGSWSPSEDAVIFTGDRAHVAVLPADLWTALDAAAASCGSAVRWLTFAHHPAYTVPQATDWLAPTNAPSRETVVEIYSEHGSSECLDTTTDGCDFAINPDQPYKSSGSVQQALTLGFALGFVGGTDSHDSRPGSVEDGPSNTAHWEDMDGDGEAETLISQYTGGGLTGAWLGADGSADALFDALEARHTLATTGPRPDLHVYARGADGQLYLPGDEVPAADGPFFLVLDLAQTDSRTGATVSSVERVQSDLSAVSASATLPWQDVWSPAAGEWTYLRIRYTNIDGSEGRVWVSPWFAE